MHLLDPPRDARDRDVRDVFGGSNKNWLTLMNVRRFIYICTVYLSIYIYIYIIVDRFVGNCSFRVQKDLKN